MEINESYLTLHHHFRGLITIHKGAVSVRPVMNFRNAPGYNLNKFLRYSLEWYSSIQNAFNVRTPSSKLGI